ncbi:Pr6Pr family membrane protein [Microbacterium nymphoidis]|uniref:Pr6Pr family membrane protein n=1 Tax=Microbacterium nymphoidis TaxID=2898586 RepID=UPI001E4DEC5E|nr:Pr6Pr family membrane protein [Microbacterium nymphoidis]MCD2498998.1 Pr6Pr family membrane protein [Microbacterium nymphoidis]
MNRPPRTAVAVARVSVGLVVLGVLTYTFGLLSSTHRISLVDYFGFFTNLTSLLTALVLVATGATALLRRSTPLALTLARAVATACMILVAVIYNLLVPGTGAAPPWVSAVLHVVLPALMLLDWIVIRDHPGIRWKHFWLLLPYPVVWLVVVLIRGVTDGWVPYGFLLPERGWPSILLTSLGLLLALLAAGGVVWAMRGSPSGHRSDPAG